MKGNLWHALTTPIGQLFAPEPIAVAEPVAVDDFGRPIVKGGRPIVGRGYQPRVIDRRSKIMPPWSPEQITSALRLAEMGDLSQQSDLFEHMEDRDGALAGFISSRRLAPSGIKWTIEPADDSEQAKTLADMVRKEISGIPNFQLAFRHAQDMIGKGLAALWIDWQPGGRTPESGYRIDGIHYINPKRYRFDWKEEKFLILPDQAPLTLDPTAGSFAGVGVQPEPWKVIILQSQTKTGHPAKAGVLRTCAMYFLLRNYALKDAAVFCDVYGMPIRIGKHDPGASDDDKAELKVALESLGSDSAAVVSKLVEITLLESKGTLSGSTPYFLLLKECERNMELAILGQEQTNTANKFGTQGQTQAGGAKVRQDLLEADCIDNEAAWTWQLCYPIVLASKFGQKAADTLCPRFKMHYEPTDDYTVMAAVDEILHTKLKLPTTLGQLAHRYGRKLPDGVDPKEIVTFNAPPPWPFGFPSPGLPPGNPNDKQQPPPSGKQPPNPNDKQPPPKPSDKQQPPPPKKLDATEECAICGPYAPSHPGGPLYHLGARGSDLAAQGEAAQGNIDNLGDHAMPSTEDALAVLAEPIRAIVREAKTLEGLRARLEKAFSDLDPSDLQRIIGRAMFVARLYGHQTATRKPKP